MAYTYAQLEGLWIQAGGSRAVAPIMAAIALAESSGNPNAKNATDNNGTQTSWGLWQISDGTHNEPVPNILDPQINAQQAVKKYQSQGLKAWGTYTSGRYKDFMQSNVGPISVGSTTVSNGAQDTSLTGDVGNAIGSGLASAFQSVMGPLISTMIWGTEALLGLGLIVAGFWVFVANTRTVQGAERSVAGALIGSKTGGASTGPSDAAAGHFARTQEQGDSLKTASKTDVKVVKSRAEFRSLRESGYTGKVRHDY